MMKWKIQRLTRDDSETRGLLIDGTEVEFCKTLERGWHDNAHDISCIPAGVYTVRRRFSPEHNCEVFGVVNVPGRGDIEIHWGNYFFNSKGCILLGATFADINHDKEIDITASKDAFDRFMAKMAGVEEFELTVIDPSAEMAVAA